MSKNKFIKKLLVAGLCALTATATMGAVACKPSGNGGGEGGHEHTYSAEWSSNNKTHWHDSECGHDVIDGEAEHTWGTDDKCTVCNFEKKLIKPTLSESDDPAPEVDQDGKIAVKYEFTAQDYEATTYSTDLKSGIYTVCAGTTIRNRTRYELKDDTGAVVKSGFELKKSIQMASASSKVTVAAPAAGKLTIWVQDGSGKTEMQELTLKKPGGTTQTIEYPATKYSSSLQLVEIELDQEGVYEITRPGGTSDIFYMAFEAKVVDSPVESIEVAATGTVDYYVGQDFGIDGLAINAIHETTGRIAPLQTGRVQVDYTEFDNTKAGTYEIGVSYVKSGKTYTASYSVNVYSYDELKLGTDTVKQGSNTSANNGTYVNHSLRQLYFKGNSLSTDGLSVILNGKNGANNNSFLLGSTLYTVSPVDMTTTGKKTVTVSYTTNGTTKQNTFDIYVIEKDAALATATSVNVAVDGKLADESVGVKNNDGAYQFKTIHQALEFLENSGVQTGASKTINLAAGTYWEKLEIKVPNLTLIGAGKDTTKIEYDSLYGAKDDGGYEHVTDSTATMNVRETAVNFTMKNVTVSNYYNSLGSYVGAPSTDQRALAILIQADKVTIDSCGLLGYQDTIELFTGRQYIVNSYISGTTDFIFGTNNTTYFKGCEIHSITNGKTDGGYITAFKGCNKGEDDAITYGAIFDQCHFTADEEVVKNKNTAIGRPWGAYANVAVINSEIDGHVSTKGYSSASKNERYVSMSGVAPTASTVKFVEYNNTGAGAIQAAVSGMKMLTESQAANYNNYQVIFGTPNGYTTVWEPVSSDVESHTVVVKNNEGTALFELLVEDGSALTLAKLTAKLAETNYADYGITGVYSDSECQTEYTYPEISTDGEIYIILQQTKISINLKDVALANNFATIISEKYGETITWTGDGWLQESKPENGVKIGTNTVITVNVVGEVTLLKGYELPAGDYIVIYKDGKATIKFVAASGTYGTYLGGISIDLTQTPEDTQTVNITVDYNDGTTENGTLEAVVGLPLGKPADPVRDGYKFTGWKVNNADYDFTENVTGAFTLVAQWESQNNYDLTSGGTVNLYEFTTGEVNGSTATYRGIIVDATSGKFYPRSSNGDAQVNAGVKIKFKVNAGTTADKISVSFTAAAGSQYIPTADISVETIDGDTYAVVTLGSGYPSTMTVTIS